MYVDFRELKQRIDVVSVVDMLGLQLTFNPETNQWRGPCPRCNDGGERALAVTPGRGYYCFADKQGGDCIALAAHIRSLSMRDAALEIVKHFEADPDPKQDNQSEEQGITALKPLTYLHYEHEAVQELGVDAKTAEALGIGYAKKGIMRGRVAIPIRTDDGTLVGYCGYAPAANPALKLPKTFHFN